MRDLAAGRAAALIGLVALARGSTARAQEPLRPPLPTPESAFELKIGTGYTQGFGRVSPAHRVADVAGAGMAVGLDADYRLDPGVSLGVQANYEEYASQRNTASRGLAGSLGLSLHGSPQAHGDPWVRLGAGYRMLWSVNPPGEPTTLLHGFQLARATVGYDLRVSPDIALAPVIGGDVDLFVWQNQSGVNTALAAPQIGAFVFAGVQGRFDMGGVATTPGAMTGAR